MARRVRQPAGTMAVSDFKARCLEMLERVRRRGEEIVLTKHGEPIARVTPIGRGEAPLKGMMRGKMAIKGDIVAVDWTDEWEAAR
jgi:prevent-host-death family protein